MASSQLHIYAPFPIPSIPKTHSRSTKLCCSIVPSPGRRRSAPRPLDAVPVRVFAEKRDNLDNLQRVAQANQQQTQIKSVPVPQPAAPTATTRVWDRFPTTTTTRTVQQMIDTMNRIMDDPFGSSLWPEVSGGYERGRRMPWAIQEGETEYQLRFDMPGMSKSDVKVWVEEDSMLVLKGEKVFKDENGANVGEGVASDHGDWASKSGYGKYSFRIALPEKIEVEKIKAEVKDGVLYVTIPKATTTRKVVDIDIE